MQNKINFGKKFKTKHVCFWKHNLFIFIIASLLNQSCSLNKLLINEQSKLYLSDSISIEIPEVYELCSIAFSLSAAAEADSNLIEKQTNYYKEMNQYFKSFQQHELIKKINRTNAKNGHYRINYLLRMQSICFDLDAKRKLIPSPDISFPFLGKMRIVNPFSIWKNKTLVEDFAFQSKFHEFYQLHKNYYDSLKNTDRLLINLNEIKNWLTKKFKTTIPSYRIVISPLTGGFHFTIPGYIKKQENSQALIFVNAAHLATDTLWQNQSFALKSGIRTMRIFTELDHHYVNPTSSKLKKQINSVGNLSFWNSGTQGYNNLLLTFNEYMTWSVFCLYVYDTYPKNEIALLIPYVEKIMIQHRGFIKFKEFNRKMLELYTGDFSGKKIDDLFAPMIDWMRTQQTKA